MNITEILLSWGLTSPLDNDFVTLFAEEYFDKCFMVDFFPHTVGRENAHKYDQIEDQIYQVICSRMYNVILKLWALDTLVFDSKFLCDRLRSVRLVFKMPKVRAILKRLNSNVISNQKQLDALLTLSKMNLIDLTLLFEHMRIVIIPSWCGFLVYFNDASQITEFSEMVRVEGLHLRELNRPA